MTLESGRRVIAGNADEKADDLKHRANLVARGRCQPIIARVFTFKEAIDAHRYADRPSQPGSVVITMIGVTKDNFLAPHTGAMGNDA